MSAEKPHLNLVVCGHVDHGKSTSVGRLLVEKGYITEREVEAHKVEAEKYGMRIAEVKYAWVLDKLKEERERGMTIDLAFWKFETDKYFYTIIDAPGHRDFVKNMITGTSQADAGLLIVSAKKGDYEAGIGPGGQTREHVFLMRTLGVNQIVVGITKMDDPTVKFDQERFEEVKNGAQDLLKMVGYDISKIPVIPISGWTGDNLTQKTTNMPWYKGKTLIDSFDETFTVPAKPLDKPLRLPVQDVYTITGVGTVPVGRVETGVLKVDDKVVFMPANKTGEIKSIETHHTLIKKAEPGDNVGFNIRGIGRDDITRGDVCGPADAPPTVVKEFIGQIVIIHHPTAIAQGYTPVLHAHTATVACEFAELLQKLDPRTGQIVEENPAYLKEGDGAVVRFRPLRPLSVESYSEFPPMGRFAIRDMGTTIAAGIIKEITEKA